MGIIKYEVTFIIIIISRYKHGSPWPYLAIRLYRPLLPGGIPGLYRHRAVFLRLAKGVKIAARPPGGM